MPVELVQATALLPVHSFYSPGCCGNMDCHPIASCDQFLELANGAIGYLGQIVNAINVYPSQDGLCHACLSMGKVICVYIQMNM
jgi:hypothetical protein